MKPLRVGVIGCGRAAYLHHLPALARIAEAQAVALADPSPEALNAVGDHFEVNRRSSDYRRLLEDPSIDAVCITAPSYLHTEIALEAMDAGKHLLVEKPLALSVEDCDLLIERASGSSVRTMLGFNLRWHRHVRRARELIEAGELGKLKLITTAFVSHSLDGEIPAWRADPARGGGLLAMQAVHHLDLWRFLLSQEIDRVACLAAMDADPQVGPATAGVVASSDGGVEISSAFCARTGQENQFAVYGSDGWLQASLYRFDGVETTSRDGTPGDIRSHLRRPARFLTQLTRAFPMLRRGGDGAASFDAEWRHFADAIQHDKPIECDFEDGREVCRVLSAVLESARTGTTVRIAELAAA